MADLIENVWVCSRTRGGMENWKSLERTDYGNILVIIVVLCAAWTMDSTFGTSSGVGLESTLPTLLRNLGIC